MFAGFYFVMKYKLPKIAYALLPKSLTSFADIQKLAKALKTFTKFSPHAIFATLGIWYFYF